MEYFWLSKTLANFEIQTHRNRHKWTWNATMFNSITIIQYIIYWEYKERALMQPTDEQLVDLWYDSRQITAHFYAWTIQVGTVRIIFIFYFVKQLVNAQLK